MKRVLISGAGGFIGSHLVRCLKQEGYWVRGVDTKLPEWGQSEANEFWLLDLREADNARQAMTGGIGWVFALAANMGGMGWISDQQAQIIRDNTLISVNTIVAASEAGVKRYFFSSSACAYPVYLQDSEDAVALREKDVYPAYPQHSYGWEKLHAEHLCRYFREAGWLDTRVGRFHAIFGPSGDWQDPRAKLPAAACRKIAQCKLRGDPRVKVWGDGESMRSFCYIDDCVEMVMRLMQSDFSDPVNVGTERLVSVNTVFDIVADIAGIEIEKVHVPGPQGVRGRNADLTLMRQVLSYEPQVSLEDGLRLTYEWIEAQVVERWQ